MDILEIIKSSHDSLYLEDLDFFETELSMHDYDHDYIVECKQKIAELRAWLEKPNNTDTESFSFTRKEGGATPGALLVSADDLAPKEANPLLSGENVEAQVIRRIKESRMIDTYKKDFKSVFDAFTPSEDFLEKNFSFFTEWEWGAIVKTIPLSEDFLEKYFGALDTKKISQYQCFSEGFFIKHFSQLDPELVLVRGKNEWRAKESRSKQLTVFLRLKGVNI